MNPGEGDRAAILVEGPSDRRAIETLARLRGRDLRAEGVVVVPMGGVTNIGHFLERLGPRGRGLRLAGMCDAAEEHHVRRALERTGYGAALSRAEMARLGFHVCVVDLEDELIRALGTDRVERTLAAEGELASFRVLQKQPAQRDRELGRQLRRFLGCRSGRKARYAGLLVEALDPARPPEPLERVLAQV
ncbi:TOPRIM nucleotidyl transferase/hydrolase domain-containing protein [Amycolatopsis aidingensis]|uniref:TOPRIM nucleotidyl transferase/hydrolase domain-containing protein n=1 Tax=Amycolatopsis aidingensis TaxID=2842453 RepID=UPI001C0DE287|nr:TOPRIM nucleotidyl transferase/hydrolase domain-containing protein [Amycolatopsis aidingensis]